VSLFDFFSGQTPEQTGRDVLLSYFNEAKNFPEFQYKSLDQWISWLNSKVPAFPIVIGDLVIGNYASTTKSQAQSRVAMLANKSGGKATIPQIVQAAGGSGEKVNYYAAVPEVAKASGKELVSIAQDVGAGVVGTLRLAKYLPVILLGAGAIAIYAYASSAGRVVGTARSKL
jgi:hypothetical protein